MAYLNAAFEKVAKAAEGRLDAAVKRGEKRLEAVGKKIAGEASQALQSALKTAIKNVETIADELRIESEQARSDFRRSLETAGGLADGAKRGMTFGAVLGPKGAAAGALAGGLLGGLAGFSIEDQRREATRFRLELEREAVALRRLMADVDRDVERVRAARLRTGRVG